MGKQTPQSQLGAPNTDTADGSLRGTQRSENQALKTGTLDHTYRELNFNQARLHHPDPLYDHIGDGKLPAQLRYASEAEREYGEYDETMGAKKANWEGDSESEDHRFTRHSRRQKRRKRKQRMQEREMEMENIRHTPPRTATDMECVDYDSVGGGDTYNEKLRVQYSVGNRQHSTGRYSGGIPHHNADQSATYTRAIEERIAQLEHNTSSSLYNIETMMRNAVFNRGNQPLNIQPRTTYYPRDGSPAV